MKDNKNTHLTLSDRQIIENGINNGSTKTAIANVLGKDKSTICKEIKLHRTLSYKSTYDIDCSKYSIREGVYSERRKPLKNKDFRRFSMPICRLFVA